MSRTFELDVQAVKLKILKYAQREDLDSAVLTAAIADVLGLTAATLDIRAGGRDFASRMDAVIERARAAHTRVLLAAAKKAG